MPLQLDESRLVEFAKSVELYATKVLEGMHRSWRGGEGAEFHSYLPYTQGDDTRRIDWKRYAASDRLYIRKFEREEKTSWLILMDETESMNYGKKKEWAQLWAASICFLANVWGDSWRVWPSADLSLDELYSALLKDELGLRLSDLNEINARPGERVILISDFLFDLSKLKPLLNQAKLVPHFVSLMDLREREFPFEDVLRFEDFESTEKLTLDAQIVRESYLKELAQHHEELRDMIPPEGSFDQVTVDGSHFDHYLLEFFEGLAEAPR